MLKDEFCTPEGSRCVILRGKGPLRVFSLNGRCAPWFHRSLTAAGSIALIRYRTYLKPRSRTANVLS